MKKAKILSVALASLVAASLAATTAFSSYAAIEDPGYTITIKDSVAGYTYEAYQVFKGDLSGNILSNIEWGDGVNDSAIVSALAADETIGAGFSEGMTAAEVAKVVATYEDGSAQAKAFAKVVGANLSETTSGTVADGKISGLPAGYYLVQNDAVPADGSYTNFILKVVKDEEATPKRSVPTLEKKVLEESYTGNAGYGTGYNDVADYDIGDDVPFELIGSLPENFGSYDTYSYMFTDTLSDGLTLNAGTVKVYLDTDKDISNGATDITSAFTFAVDSENSQKFTVSCDDIKSITDVTISATSKIIVQYTAKLDTDAVIGLDGNTNKADLTFSNNPNGEGKGTTPEDKVIVFTYELDTTKVNGADTNEKLAGAEFKLMNAAGKWVIVDEAGKVTGWADEEDDGSTLTSEEETGLFKVIGLDDGTYELKETKAPAGYNLLANTIKLVIDATTTNVQNWNEDPSTALTALTIKVGEAAPAPGDVNSGIVSTTVKNNKGSVLPSTGGIGTTIFYVCGGIIVAAAAVLLIAKLRKREA